jgi:hypothetical protein
MLPGGHTRKLKESEKGFTGMINKGKRIIISKFSSFIIGEAGTIDYMIVTDLFPGRGG